MHRGPVVLLALIVVVFLSATALPSLVGVVADWYWFEALGFQTVFLTSLMAKLVLGVGVGVLAFLFFFLNLRLAQRGLVPDPLVVRLGREPSVDVTQILRRLSWPAAALLGLIVGLIATGGWLAVLRFLERTPFNEVDPIFGRDVGYYVFSLPVISSGIGLALALLTLGLLLVVPLYLLRRDIVVMRRRVTIEPSAEWHLAVLVAAFFVVLAINVYFVRIPSLLYSTTGPLFGASHTDLVVRRPLLHAAWITALVGAVMVLLGPRARALARNTAAAIVLYIAVSGVLGAIVPGAMQRLVVIPNELVKETPQLEHHISATRRAWALDDVTVRDLTGEATLTLDDIRANAGTIRNVRLWDRDPLLQTFGQLQEIRTYYDFVSVDDDRYWIDGEYRQVLLSPRELNSAALPTRTFINERLTFTHGMGLTLGPVNQVTQEGLPVLFVKDLPPASSVSLTVTRPELYFGELSNDYVFVKTRQREFDYPAGDQNAFTTYEGMGGVTVSSWLRRAVLSARFASLKILLSQDIGEESRALYHREIRERAAKALPFLRWDGDPYLVITEDGRLKWMLDAYTFTSRYPYAQPIFDGTNYMRNSVKVVIDAYDGTVVPYVAEPDDPLIVTYAQIFADIFVPLDSMPADLRAHIRYPEDIFAVQTALYTTYHMREPATFYYREDQWQIPSVARPAGVGRDPFLRHIVMKLPEEEQEEFIFMVPFTPRQKENLAAWMVARNDGEHYGQLVVYRFPRQSLVFGPVQIINRMNQNTEISRQVSLWDQRGSEVIRGNLLVIPIEESLIFVQALYLRAEGGQIPELKRVVVAYQNQVVMEETLARGLQLLFGGGGDFDRARPVPVAAAAAALTGDAAAGIDVSALVRQAAQHYEAAMAAQRAGDWGRYGEEIRQVGELVRRLQDLTEGAGSGN